MTALQIIEKIGNEAVQKLRLQKLRSGHPFMINSKDLESNQCYLEYSDGSIQLVFLKNAAKEFTVIRTLSDSEELSLRKRYGFPRL
jgi:hydrogenase maturation factor HypF (carbamoyltransferase family)